MAGFSPMLPLIMDGEHGFELTQNMVEVVKQNFKNLILTIPGERIMIPDFGVGIRTFLFEMNDETTYGAIRSAITTQVKKYMPYIGIENVLFNVDEFNAPNSLNLAIFYNIQPLQLESVLELTIEAQS